MGIFGAVLVLVRIEVATPVDVERLHRRIDRELDEIADLRAVVEELEKAVQKLRPGDGDW